MEIKKVLVTGDRGYIGSTLVPLLIKKGFYVVGIDTEYFKKELGKTVHIKYKKITKDVRKLTSKDLKGIDGVIHLSALSNDPMGSLDENLTEEINYKSSVRLAKLAKKAKVKRFLFASSCSIYGIGTQATVNENSPVNPLTAYAKSKIRTEKELQKLADSNFTIGLLRNSTVYGFSPRFRNDLVVNNFVTCAIATNEIKVMSDGSPWRPLIDVRDLSEIFVEFLRIDSKKINGKVINVGFKENNFQVKQILGILKKELPNCIVRFTGEHGKDTRSYKVNFDTFNSLFPQSKQNWPLQKSIKNLIMELRKSKYSQKEYFANAYTRLHVLNTLLEKKKLTKKLYWKK